MILLVQDGFLHFLQLNLTSVLPSDARLRDQI